MTRRTGRRSSRLNPVVAGPCGARACGVCLVGQHIPRVSLHSIPHTCQSAIQHRCIRAPTSCAARSFCCALVLHGRLFPPKGPVLHTGANCSSTSTGRAWTSTAAATSSLVRQMHQPPVQSFARMTRRHTESDCCTHSPSRSGCSNAPVTHAAALLVATDVCRGLYSRLH